MIKKAFWGNLATGGILLLIFPVYSPKYLAILLILAAVIYLASSVLLLGGLAILIQEVIDKKRRSLRKTYFKFAPLALALLVVLGQIFHMLKEDEFRVLKCGENYDKVFEYGFPWRVLECESQCLSCDSALTFLAKILGNLIIFLLVFVLVFQGLKIGARKFKNSRKTGVK
jgi:amino acid transporter